MTDERDEGIVREGSLTPGGNRVGPDAWRLIVALNQYDDWMGAVLAVVDEASPEAGDPHTLLAELDACKPLMNGAGPAQGGRAFSGWEVPHWLMLRVRAALREVPA